MAKRLPSLQLHDPLLAATGNIAVGVDYPHRSVIYDVEYFPASRHMMIRGNQASEPIPGDPARIAVDQVGIYPGVGYNVVGDRLAAIGAESEIDRTHSIGGGICTHQYPVQISVVGTSRALYQ